ncbi:hypothetical protein L1D34_25635 [Vibrio mediterranei]|uniref:hypothetical protein n=1 Tax=Vibrio mediterranei TaxID=689 RepID=UPI001EFE980C|nr:hypothetical protein [Vibrio mediterranei]MCG9628206.1 hypothetical protein [Vibrio mediterranei]
MTLNEFAKKKNIKIAKVVAMSGFGRSTLFNWWSDPKTRTRAIVIVLGCAEAQKYTLVLRNSEVRALIDSLAVDLE